MNKSLLVHYITSDGRHHSITVDTEDVLDYKDEHPRDRLIAIEYYIENMYNYTCTILSITDITTVLS